MDPRQHDELRELLAVYALGAVDDDERRAVDAHLPACHSCSAEVADLRSLIDLLGTID